MSIPEVGSLLMLTVRVALAVAPTATIDSVKTNDLTRVASLHIEYLEGGLFRRLGGRFLAKYYETFVSSPYGYAGALREGDELCGYIVGTFDDASHYAWVMKNCGRRLAIAGVLAMLVRPIVLVSFLRTRLAKYVRGVFKLQNEASVVRVNEPGGSLTHIVVARTHRRRGLGNLLVESFVDACAEKGTKRLQLLTRANNPTAHSFYRHLGWSETGIKKSPDSAAMTIFTLTVEEPVG